MDLTSGTSNSVYGVTTQSGTTASVIVSDTGQLGTVASSERFKKHIATMEKASEAELKEQALQTQKVSAQLRLHKPEPQTVLNNH